MLADYGTIEENLERRQSDFMYATVGNLLELGRFPRHGITEHMNRSHLHPLPSHICGWGLNVVMGMYFFLNFVFVCF